MIEKIQKLYKKYKKGIVAFLGALSTTAAQVGDLFGPEASKYFTVGIVFLTAAGVIQVRNQDPPVEPPTPGA